MSDGTGGSFFNNVDLNSLSDADWANLMAGINTPNLDLTSADFGWQPGSGFGMNDRGLGTTQDGGLGSGSDGTLTADQIGLLGNSGSVGFQAGGGNGSPPTNFNNGSGGSPGGGGAGGGIGGGAGNGILGALGGIPGLAGILAPLLGGLLNSNATKNATNQTVAGINKASDQVQGILGQPSPFAPFTQAGQGAMAKLQNMNYQPLAPQFSNLGAGRGTTLGAMGRGRS